MPGDDGFSVYEGDDVSAVDRVELRRPGMNSDGILLTGPVFLHEVEGFQDAAG
jgi:hypothetical protein